MVDVTLEGFLRLMRALQIYSAGPTVAINT
jgi:hypothetical protein